MSDEARALLRELRALDVEVVVLGDEIRFRPAEVVGEGLRRRLNEHRGAVIGRLQGSVDLGDEPAARPTSGRAAAARRLELLLRGRLWADRDGWWPKDTGLSQPRAEVVAGQALEARPRADQPEPRPMTRARGVAAVRAWQQVVACLMAELGWSADRAGRAAALVVDPCFDLTAPGREGEA